MIMIKFLKKKKLKINISKQESVTGNSVMRKISKTYDLGLFEEVLYYKQLKIVSVFSFNNKKIKKLFCICVQFLMK